VKNLLFVRRLKVAQDRSRVNAAHIPLARFPKKEKNEGSIATGCH
jgi:hypothetical protein